MSKKSKWFAMTAMLVSGATLFQGCLGFGGLGGFTRGFFGGFPSSGPLGIVIDVLNESLLG